MTKLSFKRTLGSVFLTPQPPIATVDTDTYFQDWAGVAQDIATDMTAPAKPPTPDELLSESLPLFIEASRWGRYISPGPASYVHDTRIFVYYNPSTNFWDLYDLAKGIFRDLGIRLEKRGGTWVAHIPIKILRDEVFVDAGLEAVEKTLLAHTGIDPVAILNEIRQRQFAETHQGIKRCKRSRQLAEAVGDAVGALIIFAVNYALYIVL